MGVEREKMVGRVIAWSGRKKGKTRKEELGEQWENGQGNVKKGKEREREK